MYILNSIDEILCARRYDARTLYCNDMQHIYNIDSTFIVLMWYYSAAIDDYFIITS